MGANYYYISNHCEHCDRFDKIHIGKLSGGWQFLFHATNAPFTIETKKTWFLLLENATIMNEYGETFTFDKFKDIVEESGLKQSHYDYCSKDPKLDKFVRESLFKDEEGWTFDRGEFS